MRKKKITQWQANKLKVAIEKFMNSDAYKNAVNEYERILRNELE